jgi:GAF domain-containing protein
LLLESDSRLFVAREAPRSDAAKQAVKYPLTLDAADFPFFQRVLATQSGLVVSDTKQEQEWHSLRGSGQLRSWLCVPLVASRQTLGLLSLGHPVPDSFTQEHLRLTKSVAIPERTPTVQERSSLLENWLVKSSLSSSPLRSTLPSSIRHNPQIQG